MRPATVALATMPEGAGEFSPPEKACFDGMAQRSAVEVVAWLDICRRRGDADPDAI